MKKSVPVSLVMLGAMSLLPASVLAHTGAGATAGFASGFGHPFAGIDHLLAMVAVGLWAAQKGGRAMWVLPGAFVAVMVLGGAIATAGVHVPYVEAGIMVSVLLFGLLTAAAFRLSLVASAVVVGVFAVFHGHAHGAEMPAAISAITYSAGFALATALLHAGGIAGGLLLRKVNVEKAVRLAGSAIGLCGAYLLYALVA